MRRCERGAATLEALLVLPVFLVLWVGVSQVHRVQGSALAARQQARACAWRHAVAGCRGPLPAGCAQANAADASMTAAAGGEQTMLDALADVAWLDMIGSALLGASTTVTSAREVPQPEVLGGGTLRVGARIYLVCNERNRTSGEIAKDAACAMTSPGSVMANVFGCGGGRPWP